VFQPIPEGWTGLVYIINGKLQVGESKPYPKHNTLIFTSSPGENGVQLTRPLNSTDEETRFVVIAGEPLDQPVVQYGPFVVTSQRKAMEAINDFRQYKNGFERARGWRSKIGEALM